MPAKKKKDPAALPSGRFVIRAPRRLHANLVKLAEAEGVSLNQLVACLLTERVAIRETIEMEIFRLNAANVLGLEKK